MYTQCPYCSTWFSINAGQLHQGRGEVRCGNCMRPFDALLNLRDTVPDPLSPTEAKRKPAPNHPDRPHSERPQTARDSTFMPQYGPEPKSAHDTETLAEGVAPSPPLGDINQLRSGDNHCGPKLEPVVVGLTPPIQRDTEDNDPGGHHGPAEREPDLSTLPKINQQAAYEHRDKPRANVFKRVAVITCLAICIAGLVAQYAWFLPNDLVTRFRINHGSLEWFCNLTGCTVPPGGELREVYLERADMRVHPKYEGALLISGALTNRSVHPKPYPTIALTLYNVEGQIIGSSEFNPAQYLNEDDPRPSKAVPPNQQVRVTFELLAPEEVAVSLEFQFI